MLSYRIKWVSFRVTRGTFLYFGTSAIFVYSFAAVEKIATDIGRYIRSFCGTAELLVRLCLVAYLTERVNSALHNVYHCHFLSPLRSKNLGHCNPGHLNHASWNFFARINVKGSSSCGLLYTCGYWLLPNKLSAVPHYCHCQITASDVGTGSAIAPPTFAIRYDTIRYGIFTIFTCAQKLTRWPA